MTQLSVNLNKIALLRNSRGHDYPNVLSMAARAVQNGAIGVTIHPRPDQRHARYSDVAGLSAWIAPLPGKELNIEGFPSEAFMNVVLEHKPDQCTLVPDADNQLTSDHGWSFPEQGEFLIPIIEQLKNADIRTSLFIDHDPEAARAAAQTGTDRVELYTGPYAEAYASKRQEEVTHAFAETARAAVDAGLGVNAGHDLDLTNLAYLLNKVPSIDEVSIGHALTVEALDQGWDSVIQQYVAICGASSL